MPPKVLGVIPARMASVRFPGKALVSIAGKPMVQHVWERASQSRYLTNLLIATDDETIASVSKDFGARVRLTRADHPSGTDRVAEVASAYQCQLVVNIQGDEPLIDPQAIDTAVFAMLDADAPMGTLMKRIENPDELDNPNVVKVISDLSGHALYFSRHPIPFVRGGDERPVAHFKHIGLYVYQRDFLLAYPTLPVGPLEEAERLEQLRALENGHRIRVVETDYESLGVDTPEDLSRLERLFAVTTASLSSSFSSDSHHG